MGKNTLCAQVCMHRVQLLGHGAEPAICCLCPSMLFVRHDGGRVGEGVLRCHSAAPLPLLVVS